MTEFSTALEDAWTAHGKNPVAIASKLDELVSLASTPEHLSHVSRLAIHVLAEHLGQWQEGLDFLERLKKSPVFTENAALRAGWYRDQAVYLIGANDSRAADAETRAAQCDPSVPVASHHIRITALAAGALAARQRLDEARRLMQEALIAASYGPTKSDPASRVLAISTHNVALDLAGLPNRDPSTTAFMLTLAQASRHWWEIAGGALEVERAEYRLAKCYIAARQGEEALMHAQHCLTLASAEGMKPYEKVYAHMAIAECQHLLGKPVEAADARASAAAMIPRLIPEVRESVTEDLRKLDLTLASLP